jgi:RNA polymerase sigma-70 factor, ECF subfamily
MRGRAGSAAAVAHAGELTSGLAALRAAIALCRDPLTDPAEMGSADRLAWRAVPQPRGAEAVADVAGIRQRSRRSTALAPKIVSQPGADTAPDTAPEAEPPDGSVDDADAREPIDEAVVALVARAQSGEADAFGELYDRYVDLIYRYIYYRVGSQALAEDLTSETFLRALRRITSFTWQGRDIGAWFVTIARNLVADHFKSGRYRLEVATSDMLDADRAEDGPENAVLDSISNGALLEAVKQLGSDQQECIVLRFLQGLSVAETALAMGKNEGAIKALQYRAVRALGRLLPQDFA